MAGWGYVSYLVSASSKGDRLIGSKLVMVGYTSGEIFTVVPNCLLCPPTDTAPVRSTGAFCKNIFVPFIRQQFGVNYRYQDDNATPHHAQLVLDFLQQGNVTKMEQPVRSPDCNPIEHIWDEYGPMTMIVPASGLQVGCIPWVQWAHLTKSSVYYVD